MGGQQKLAKAQKQANQIADRTRVLQSRSGKQANRIAVRSGKREKKAAATQTAALVAAEKESAAALAALTEGRDVQTEFIVDEEAKRKRGGMGGSSAYGFSRPAMTGLGGGNTRLG